MVLLAFSCLVIIATLIGCGTAVVDGFLIPVGGVEAKFAFVANSNPDSQVDGLTISAYTVNPTTGALTAVPGSPFTTKASGCCGTLFIDVDPNSRFLYVPNRDANSVSVFSIASTGALTEISGSPFASGGNDTYAVAVHPNGNSIYVSNRSGGNITAFSVASNGQLTSLGSVDAFDSPRHLFIDPQGRFLYASDESEGGIIDAYTIQSNGSLAPIAGTPFGSFCAPHSGTVDATGKFLLVADPCDDTVSVFSIASTGVLSEVTSQGSPFPAGSGAFGVVEVASGGVTYMAVNNMYAATISVYTFDSTTGKLTPVSGSPFNTLGLSRPHYMAVDPSGKFGYIVDMDNSNITGVTVGSGGEPASIPGSPFSGGGIDAPSKIVISH